MQFNGEKIDWKSEWIMHVIQEADTYENFNSILSKLSVYDGFSKHIVRYRLQKLESAKLIDDTPAPTRGEINDRKEYKLKSDIYNQYINEKGRDISRPPATEADVEEVENNIEDINVEINRMKSEHSELFSLVEDIKRLFRGRSERNSEAIDDLQSRVDDIEEQLAEIEEWQEYLIKHAEAQEANIIDHKRCLNRIEKELDIEI